MNNLLPARTGELSYVYLLKTEQKITTGEGLATLVIARIFDFIIISIFFLPLFLFIKNLTADFLIVIEIGILFLFLMVILLFSLLFYGNVILKKFKTVAHYIYPLDAKQFPTAVQLPPRRQKQQPRRLARAANAAPQP